MSDVASIESAESTGTFKPTTFWHAIRKLIHGVATCFGYALLAAFALGLIHDFIIRLNSIEMHRNVHELVRSEHPQWTTTVLLADQDFDGDGIPDEAYVMEHRVDPAFGMGIWKLLTVKSGRTGEALLLHGLGLIERVEGWRGDHDGNGTTDIAFRDGRESYVLGYVAGEQ